MPRGIDDLPSTSSDVVAAFWFFVAFSTDCLSIDRLHVNRHVILFKRVIELNGSLLIHLSGKREDDELLGPATFPGMRPGMCSGEICFRP